MSQCNIPKPAKPDLYDRPRWRQCQFPTNIVGGHLMTINIAERTAIGPARRSLE
jgi:hypothetical protein